MFYDDCYCCRATRLLKWKIRAQNQFASSYDTSCALYFFSKVVNISRIVFEPSFMQTKRLLSSNKHM